MIPLAVLVITALVILLVCPLTGRRLAGDDAGYVKCFSLGGLVYSAACLAVTLALAFAMPVYFFYCT